MQMVLKILQHFKINLLEALKGKKTTYIEAFLSKMYVWVMVSKPLVDSASVHNF